MVYCLEITPPEGWKEFVKEALLKLEISDFVEGSIECDIDAEYDPEKQFTVDDDLLLQLTPILIFHSDEDYLKSIQSALLFVFAELKTPLSQDIFKLSSLKDKNWQESWKESFRPLSIKGKMAILPPWEESEKHPEAIKIFINPGMAFGTGQHETTQLCLELLIEIEGHLKSLLDVGTGSGILAIAAQKLGWEKIIGTDLDPTCIPIAIENAEKNHAPKNAIEFCCQSIEHFTDMKFDTILANIQSKPLMKIVPHLQKCLNEKSVLILSGILAEEASEFADFLQNAGLNIIERRTKNEWCAFSCKL